MYTNKKGNDMTPRDLKGMSTSGSPTRCSLAEFALIAALVCVGMGDAAADDKVPNGARCIMNSDCQSNQCSAFTCKPVKKKRLGASCVSDQDCYSGECKHFVCQPLQHKKVGKGKKCVFDGDCWSGRCEGVFSRRCE